MQELNEAPGKKKFSQLLQQRTRGVPLRHYSQETSEAFIDPRRDQLVEPPVSEILPPAVVEEVIVPPADGQQGLSSHLDWTKKETFREIAKSMINAKNNTGHIVTSIRLPWEIIALSTDLAHEYRQSRTQIIKALLEYALIETGYVGDRREAVLREVILCAVEERKYRAV